MYIIKTVYESITTYNNYMTFLLIRISGKTIKK